MKKALLVSVLLIPLMFITIPVGYAANPPPPPPDMKFVGPAVVGTITITPGVELPISATFSGHCRGIPFTIEPSEFGGGTFDEVTPESLEGFTLGFAGDQIPMDCAAVKGGYEAIIYNVTHFTKIGNVITAHVVALFLVPK